MTGHTFLAEAKRALSTDPDVARRMAEAALRQRPSDEAALLLASARRRCGDAPGAIALLGPMARRRPDAWGVHFEHGLALCATGAITAAIAAVRRATECNPGSFLARHVLNDLMLLTGPAQPDERLSQRIADPALRAAVAGMLRDEPAARDTIRDRFGLDISDIFVACLIADIGNTLGLHDAVARLLLRVRTSAADYLPAMLRHAEALHRSGADTTALDIADRAIIIMPHLVAALTLRAAILMNLARENEAVDLLAQATTLAPDDARLWQSYGHALRAVGRRDEALTAYRAAIRIAPAFGEAYWSMADLKTGGIEGDEIAAMQRLARNDDLGAEPRSYLHFALGRAHEDAGDAAGAFSHYLAANALRRQIVPYDAAAQDAFVRRTIATFDAKFFAARGDAGIDRCDPIFVLGMPRSGSSLVEQILASHPQIEGASELPDITAIARTIARGAYPEGVARLATDEFATLGADYLARTQARRRTDRPYFVDKFPGNVLHIALIHLMLPNARIIDVRRDARDCCVSLFSQSFAAGQGYSYDLGDLGGYYNGYLALMRHFDTVLPGRVLHVSYEALVEDAEGETRRLLDHCGLPFDAACLRFFETPRAVRTASSEQVRRPIYRGSIGRWQRFEPWLAPLLDSLTTER